MKRLSLLLACVLILSVCTVAPAAAAAGFELQIDEATRTVTGYSGTLPARLEIPAGIQCIGNEAFARSTELEELSLPEGLISIDRGAFIGCSNLREANWPGTLVNIGNGAFCGTALHSLVLPDSLRTLSWGAFNNCQELTSVSFPSGLRTIGTNSFRGCTSLTDVYIPEGVQYLGGFCFADCTALVGVQLPSTLLTIQDGAFKGCSKLKSLDIPSGPRYLSYTFDSCAALESLSIPATVERIEGGVFKKCDKLKTLWYGGTKEAWQKALSYGDSSVHSRVEITFGGAAAPPATSVPSAPPSAAPPEGQDYPYLAAGSPYTIAEEEGQVYFLGVEIGSTNSYTSVSAVAAAFIVPAGAAVEILSDGELCDPEAPIATGNTIQLLGVQGEARDVAVVVAGDVCGTGLLDISQLVRMARALNGSAPLEGPYLRAGCLSGGSSISISDLVLLAQMLTR